MPVWEEVPESESFKIEKKKSRRPVSRCKATLECGVGLCCDRKSRTAYAQSFAPRQQATIEITRRDHSIIACSRHVYMVLFFAHIPFVVNHTFNATPPALRLQQLQPLPPKLQSQLIQSHIDFSTSHRPLPNWKVGCSIHSHWVNCRNAPWARAFTSTAPAKHNSGFSLPP